MTRTARHAQRTPRSVPAFVDVVARWLGMIRVASGAVLTAALIVLVIVAIGVGNQPRFAGSPSTERMPAHGIPGTPTPGAPAGSSVPTDGTGTPNPGGTPTGTPANADETTGSTSESGSGASPTPSDSPSPSPTRGRSDSAPGATNRPTPNPHH